MVTALTPTPNVATSSDDISGSVFRSQPHNVEAEKALLGAIFIDNRAFEKVADFLQPQHFFVPQNGGIFKACARLIERGQIADPVTLKTLFEHDEDLVDIGGAAYLADLAASAATVINAGEYGRILHDLYLKRQLIALGQDVVNDAFGAEVDETADQQIEKTEHRLFELAATGEFEGGFRPFKDTLLDAIKMAEAAHKREGRLSGVPTGLRDLDKLLGGLHRSDLVILAGRPSMGKTALATNIAFNAAYTNRRTQDDGAVVGFFSLEMSAEQLASRIISEQTNISSDRMRKGELTNDEFNRLAVGSQELYATPIFIDDSPALSVAQLRTRARRLKRTEKLGLIVVDYLQLMSPGPASRHDGRVQEISEITRGLKTLAKELDVPVLALSQLSRAVEQRDNKRPQLADLRDSGTIEQDADVVMFIFREEYYLERDQPLQRVDEKEDHFHDRYGRWELRRDAVKNKAEVLVAKQRHGPTGSVNLFFEGAFTRFGDLDTRHDTDT
jgi:replicative DNA helicase